MQPLALAEDLMGERVSGGWVCGLRLAGGRWDGCLRSGTEVHTYRACDLRDTCRSAGRLSTHNWGIAEHKTLPEYRIGLLTSAGGQRIIPV